MAKGLQVRLAVDMQAWIDTWIALNSNPDILISIAMRCFILQMYLPSSDHDEQLEILKDHRSECKWAIYLPYLLNLRLRYH